MEEKINNRWLLNGGDERLRFNKYNGMNRYGCLIEPRKEIINFSSTTATTISEYANKKLLKIISEINNSNNLIEACLILNERVQNKLKIITGIGATESSIFITSSGTDAIALAIEDIDARNQNPLSVILCGSDETASGAISAASRKYISEISIFGEQQPKDYRIGQKNYDRKVVSFSLKGNHGCYQQIEDLDIKLERIIKTNIDQMREVVIVITDQSKLGVTYPLRSTITNLKKKYKKNLNFIVDACQMRLDKNDISCYLKQNVTVLLSGSKFLTGFPFSGAIIKPSSQGLCLRDPFKKQVVTKDNILHSGNYTARSYMGVLLRWSTAILEWEKLYKNYSDTKLDKLLEEMRLSIENTLREFDFSELSITSDNQFYTNPESLSPLSSQRTIFPFFVKDRNGKYLNYYQLKTIYQLLNVDISSMVNQEYKEIASRECHIGQPVGGFANGSGVLRISIGIRMLYSVIGKNSYNSYIDQQMFNIRCIMQKIYLIREFII